MQYQDEVTGEIEFLWNSRDGVTPFVIESLNGNSARHVNWQMDRCIPDFVPDPGMRIFVDASPKHAHIRESARDYVDRHWDQDSGCGMTMANTLCKVTGEPLTKEEAVEFFIGEWTGHGHPTVVRAD